MRGDFKYSKMATSGANKQAINKWKVPELKAYLQYRGITVLQKRKDELVDLAEKGRDLSLEPMKNGEKPKEVIRNKLQLDHGLLPCANTLPSHWTSDFSIFLTSHKVTCTHT